MYTFEFGKKLLKGKDSLEKMEDGIVLQCYIMNLSGKAQKKWENQSFKTLPLSIIFPVPLYYVKICLRYVFLDPLPRISM